MISKNKKIFSAKQLKQLLKKLRYKKIVFTNGCFDLLHVGHISLLRKARRAGDVLVVALNTDSSVRKLKGQNRPIVPLKERMEVISALEMVDYVTWFSEKTPKNLVKRLEPNVIVKGGDYKPEKIVGADFVMQRGGKVVVAPFKKNKSTTELLRKIQNL